MHSEAIIVFGITVFVTAGLSHRRPRFDARRIVNGNEQPHSQFPHLVSIEYYDGNTEEWSTTCGGSIINTATVLTACHCATEDEKIHGYIKYPADPEKRRIVAGTAYWERNTPTRQTARVKKIVTHPKCQNFNALDRNFLNDVALFFLKDSLVYGPQVQPLRLPSTDILTSVAYLKKLVANGAWCAAVGWGRTVEDDFDQSEKLIGAAVQLLTAEECRERFCRMTSDHCQTDFDRVGQFCVASPVASDCFGDSGGPLTCNGFVVGTVSYGDHCWPELPTVYQGLKPILEVLLIYKVKVDSYDSGFGWAFNSTLPVKVQSAKRFPTIYLPVLSELLHEISVLVKPLWKKRSSD